MTHGRTYDHDTTWSGVTERLGWLIALFGQPVDILRETRLAPRDARILRGWLAGLETLVRALLLLLASDIDPPPPPPAGTGGRPRPRRAARLADALADADSARWRGVAFRTFPAPPPPQTPHRARARIRRHRTAHTADAAPLARRLEALIRVAEAPEPHARRLALRLSRRPAQDRRRLLRPPPGRPHLGAVPPTLWDEARAAQNRARAKIPRPARPPTAA